MNDVNRREFFRFLVATGAFASLSGGSSVLAQSDDEKAAAATPVDPGDSLALPGITRTVLVDDCLRLAAHSREVSDIMKRCLSRQVEIVRLAGIAHYDDPFISTQLRGIRNTSAPDRKADLFEEKAAFVLGCVCYRAVDRQMDAGGETAKKLGGDSPDDCRIYRDAFVLRHVYVKEGAAALNVEDVESLVRGLWQRTLLSWHTFIPDQKNIDRWMEGLFRTYRRFTAEARRYAEAVCRPEPDKVDRFVRQPGFYDDRDEIIRIARSVQNGAADETLDIRQAIRAARDQSLYARALRKGCIGLHAAGEYFERLIDEDRLHKRLEIGRPVGRIGKAAGTNGRDRHV